MWNQSSVSASPGVFLHSNDQPSADHWGVMNLARKTDNHSFRTWKQLLIDYSVCMCKFWLHSAIITEYLLQS